ncbi:hypothetical protein BGZ74_000394 [Mortierella antarctica]|nr:hypothetical protein BGZ74_000394 [Mortierella antarctica]
MDNNNTQNIPILCANNCGFYGANSHNHHSGGLRIMRRNHHNTTPCPFHHIHATNSDSNSNSNSNAVNGNDNDSDNDNDFGTCPTNDHPSIIVQSLHSCGQPPKHTGLDGV